MKKMILFTDGFPYDPGETPFIYNELCELTKSYDVDIIANVRKQYENADICIELPKNVRYYKHLIEDIGRKEKLKFLMHALKCEAWKLEKSEFGCSEHVNFRMYEEAFTYLVRSLIFYNWIVSTVKLEEYEICYTYWNSYATLAVAINKNKYSELKLVTRTHGYDLFNERAKYNHQCFKKYVDSRLDKVFFIAQNGKKYYLEHFANALNENKYVFNPIGCLKAGAVPTKEYIGLKVAEKQFILVSCSSVIPLKRVNIIVEALARISDTQIHWIHFGGGNQLGDIRLLCQKLLDKKDNITYELKGRVDNSVVRAFYDSTYVDCFITTSSTEGSPVSVQEALAYGIPVIGTDVGEIPTLIEECGILISVETDVKAVANAIQDMANMGIEQKEQYRSKAFNRWKEEFDAEKNSRRFVELINEL